MPGKRLVRHRLRVAQRDADKLEVKPDISGGGCRQRVQETSGELGHLLPAVECVVLRPSLLLAWIVDEDGMVGLRLEDVFGLWLLGVGQYAAIP